METVRFCKRCANECHNIEMRYRHRSSYHTEDWIQNQMRADTNIFRSSGILPIGYLVHCDYSDFIDESGARDLVLEYRRIHDNEVLHISDEEPPINDGIMQTYRIIPKRERKYRCWFVSEKCSKCQCRPTCIIPLEKFRRSYADYSSLLGNQRCNVCDWQCHRYTINTSACLDCECGACMQRTFTYYWRKLFSKDCNVYGEILNKRQERAQLSRLNLLSIEP